MQNIKKAKKRRPTLKELFKVTKDGDDREKLASIDAKLEQLGYVKKFEDDTVVKYNHKIAHSHKFVLLLYVNHESEFRSGISIREYFPDRKFRFVHTIDHRLAALGSERIQIMLKRGKTNEHSKNT